jgi:hypothetical protein
MGRRARLLRALPACFVRLERVTRAGFARGRDSGRPGAAAPAPLRSQRSPDAGRSGLPARLSARWRHDQHRPGEQASGGWALRFRHRAASAAEQAVGRPCGSGIGAASCKLSQNERSVECPGWNPGRDQPKELNRLPILARFAEHCAAQNVGARVAMQGCSGTTTSIYPGNKTGAANPINRSSEEKVRGR